MKFLEIVIEDEANIPQVVLKCLSCSIAGVELERIYPDTTGYTQSQIELLNKIATVHGRTHANPRIRAYNFTRPGLGWRVDTGTTELDTGLD